MSYIGSTPTTQNFIAGTDSFNGTGSATNFTLSRFVNSTNDIQVVVNNVVQYPPNYSVSGNTLTISPAPSSGTNNVYVRYLSTTLQSVTPPGGTTVNGSWGVNGDLNFYGNARRITGDFSNATLANRVMFQNSVTNANTNVAAIPNGTATVSVMRAYGASDPTNTPSIAIAQIGTTESRVTSEANGTSSFVPMTFYTGGSERMRVDTSGNVGIGLTPAGTGFLEIKAGTTSAVPLELTAGTNATTAVAGGVEYDGRVFYATPQGTQRGVVPGAQFFRLNSGVAGANVNTAQSVFGVGVTLSASTVYAFEGMYYFAKTAGATSHTLNIMFGGTATTNNYFHQSITYPNTTAAFTNGSDVSTAVTAATGAIATATSSVLVIVKGTVSINAGGTFIPQYQLSAAPGGAYTANAGSHFLIYPIGASGANTSVGTWA